MMFGTFILVVLVTLGAEGERAARILVISSDSAPKTWPWP